MASAPWFPAYNVETCNTDSQAFMTNSHLVRLTFRVKDEELEGVINTLMPNTPIETRKRLLRGR
ncbi:hypothetical protein [Mycobacteroides chelonae]|uniref:hypothetical protein n=1 Tax=Mycobacteroides chelonae TaxID=1774 RepID=UPI000991C326|nr:hypothetical protein [Mycobacteroides chelonae]